MKIGYKLILSYLLVALLASFTAWSALNSYKNINNAFDTLTLDPIPTVKALEDIRRAGTHIVSATGELCLLYGESQFLLVEPGEKDKKIISLTKAEEYKLFNRGYQDYEEAIRRYAALIKDAGPVEAGYLKTIKEHGDELKNLSSQIIELKKKGVAGEEILALREKFDAQDTAYLQAMDIALAHEYDQIAAEQNNVQGTISNSVQATYLTTFLTFMLAIGSGLYISRLFANRIVKLKEATERVGEGELEMQIEVQSRDEIGDLAHSFNNMIRDLQISRSELAATKNFTDKIMDSMVDFVVVVNMDLTIAQVNKAALKINGYEEHELIGRSINMLIADKPYTQKGVDILREKGFFNNFDKLNLNKDGSITPISMSLSILKDDQGQELGIVCVGKDTSERKRQEMERQAITEIVRSVMTTSGLDELFKIAHESIGKIMYAENCFIALYNPNTNLIHYEYWVDQVDPVPSPRPIGKSFTSYILQTGKPLMVTEEIKNQMQEQGEVENNGSDFASWIGVPLRIGLQTIGVLAVQHYEKSNVYSRRDLDLLSSVGDQFALAIERKRTEIELKANEMQLREAQRIANLGSWQWDILTNELSWSDELYNIYGFQPQAFEATYEIFTNHTHPDDLKATERIIENALSEKVFSSFDYRIIRPDGTVRTLHSNGRVIVDKTGQIIKMVGTAQDITERRKVEREMERLNIEVANQRQRLNDILDNVPCVIWEAPLDLDAIHLTNKTNELGFVNSYVSTMYGYSPEEWLSAPDFWFSLVHPDDREIIFRNSERLFADGYGSNVVRWMTKDERTVWGETQIVVVKDETGQPIGLRGVTTDITERKEIDEILRNSEEQHRLLFETNPQPSFVYDLETLKFLAVNQAAVRHYGYSREEFLNTITLKNIRPPEDIPLLLEKVSKITPGQDIILAPSRHRKSDGTVMDVEITSHALVFDGRQAEIVLVNDVTERRQAEEQLKVFNQKLQQSNRELQDFAYVASHDLQEPLRKVQAFADRLISKYGETLEGTGVDYLERMRNAGGRMQTLIQDLLTFSRVTTKAQPFVPVDLEKITQEVLSDLEVKIEETSARIEIVNLPTLDADPLQMRQLIQNLVGNALKFCPPDVPPVIEISAGQAVNHPNDNGNGNGKDFYQIRIKDNGIGFDEKYLDKIFTVFQRLHGRSEYEGSGIGLAVCRKIVERHHGHITAESAPGEGASFIITLPFKQPKTENN